MSATDLPPFGLDPIQPAARKQPLDAWAAATELATRFVARSDDPSEASSPADQTIGKPVGANTWELFVSCAPADALTQQFDIRTPLYMALHALGATSSRRFLAEIAQQMGVPVKRLHIRRQGFGTVLATLYFADVRATNGQFIRIYATTIKGDEATQSLLRHLLLARSQMTAVLVDEMSPLVMASSMDALGKRLQDGRRAVGTLVFLPLADSPGLEGLVNGLARQTGVPVRRTPRVSQPMEAWPFLATTWNILRAELNPAATPGELMLFRSVGADAAPNAPASNLRQAGLAQPAGRTGLPGTPSAPADTPAPGALNGQGQQTTPSVAAVCAT